MRRRITTIAVAIAAAVLVLMGVAVVAVIRFELYENLDRSLDQRAAEVEAVAVAGDSSLLVTSNPEDHFAQVLDREGNLIAGTANANDVAFIDPFNVDSGAFTSNDVPIEDDAYRVMVRSVADGSGYVVVGENIDDLRDIIRALILALLAAIPLALAALGLAVWWLVGRTLRPVDDIRREVDDIELSDLSKRVPAPSTGDEVDQLAATMNRMLARLETSSEQQRRFVADASHELRTPLTRIRTQLEVDLRQEDADLRPTVESVLDDVTDMQQLVDDLLFLARRDATRSPDRPRETVDLDAIIADEVGALSSRREVTIDVSSVEAAIVVGRESHLRRLVRNLLTNAVRYASSRVEVTLSERGGEVILTVSDDGPGIPEADRQRVFERFVRLDESRGQGDGGAGLGLAIVREIALDHGGDVRIEDRIGGGVVFVVTLPRTVGQ